MKNRNGVPSDGYSKEVFEDSLGRLNEIGVTYEPPSHERDESGDWEFIHQVVSDDEKVLLGRLDVELIETDGGSDCLGVGSSRKRKASCVGASKRNTRRASCAFAVSRNW